MYRKFFGLKKLPFKVTPDPDFFFEYAERNQIVDALIYSIDRGDPIIKVVGDVGCGKTTILRQVLNHVSNTKYSLIYISSPNLTAKDMVFLICRELNIPVKGGEEKYVVVKQIQQKLISLHKEGRRAVILVDEAQAMPVDTLEELRLLSNLETDTDKLLQIVLFGQPELDKTLQIPQLRQLQSRVAYEVYLEPLDCKEVWRYLNYRMQRAGYSGDPVFSKNIACKVHAITRGLPREINFLADKLLMSAFSHGDEKVKSKHFQETGYQNKRGARFTVFLIFILVAIMALYLYFDRTYRSELMVEASTSMSGIMLKAPASHEDNLSTPPLNTQKFATLKENVKLQRLAQALNLPLSKAKPIFEIYQKSSGKVERLLRYRYTVQVMVVPFRGMAEAYKEIKSKLPGALKNKLIPILDLKEGRVIFVLDFDNGVSRLNQVIKQLPVDLSRPSPYVMMTEKYRKIFMRTENYLTSRDI